MNYLQRSLMLAAHVLLSHLTYTVCSKVRQWWWACQGAKREQSVPGAAELLTCHTCQHVQMNMLSAVHCVRIFLPSACQAPYMCF